MPMPVGQQGNSVSGTTDHTGIGLFGSNFHVGGNFIINEGAGFNLPKTLEHSVDVKLSIRVLEDLIEVLEYKTRGAPGYHELIDELRRILKVVVAISKLEICESQHRRFLAVEQAIDDLHNCLDGFLRLGTRFRTTWGTGHVDWKKDLWGIWWTRYEKEELDRFRAELEAHTSSMDTLLITLQISSPRPGRRQLSQVRDYALQQRLPINFEDTLADHTSLLRGLTKPQTEFLQSLMRTIQQQQVFLQQLQQLPPQVELQKPVILLDACGRVAPFHLDFIDSREAFIAVIKARFKDIGLKKIEKGEFCLEERHRKREIDLSRPWSTVFLPGQTVDMSMIFQRSYAPLEKCHGCGAIGQYDGENFECSDCGINCTRRIQDVIEGAVESSAPEKPIALPLQPSQVLGKRNLSSVSDAEPSIGDFRRVQVIELRRRLKAPARSARALWEATHKANARPVTPPGIQPGPPPPPWLLTGLTVLRSTYPRDSFEGFMRNTPINTLTDTLLPNNSIDPDQPLPPNVEYRFLPRIRCNDCPGKLYTAGPGTTVENFEVHLRNKRHRYTVEMRMSGRVFL